MAQKPQRPVVPPSIEQAWGRRSRPNKGPKPGLSLERIVEVAVSLAQAEGFGAISMGRVARELAVSTMALYRYVEAKDELVALMVDAAAGTPVQPPADGDWRANLGQWASTLYDAYTRHRWAVQAPISGIPPTPNQVGWLEAGLCCLRETLLQDEERLSTILLLSVFVRGAASIARDLAEATQATVSGGGSGASYGHVLAQVLDPERFPEVARMMKTNAFDDGAGMGQEFEFGLERILDGVAVAIARRGDAAAGT